MCFVLLSNCLLLFLVCFCHVASATRSTDWARSSALSIFVDVVALELAAVLIFALLATARGFCKGGRCALCLLLALELYRFYRNFVEA